jgi:hypothetical protein
MVESVPIGMMVSNRKEGSLGDPMAISPEMDVLEQMEIYEEERFQKPI